MFKSIERPLSEAERSLREAYNEAYILLKEGDLFPGDLVKIQKIESGLNELVPHIQDYREMLANK